MPQIYSTISGRRFDADLREAKARGYLSRLPHYNSVFRYHYCPNVFSITVDWAMEVLFQYSQFHEVAYGLFHRLIEGQLTLEEEELLKSLGLKF